MGWLLELLLDGIREICSQFIVDMMELVTEMFTELLSCNLSLFEELFSVVGDLYKNVIVPMGIAMLLLILVWQLFKSMFGKSVNGEEPIELLIRSAIALFFVVGAKPIVNYILKFAGTPYQWVTGTEIKVESFAGYVSALEGVTETLGIGKLSISLLMLIMQFVVAWNYFKMLFVIAERYVLLGVFSYTAPLAFSTGGSKSTNNILASWSKMFGGQVVLIILNAWCMKMFLSGYGNLMASSYGFSKFFVATLCLVGFCKITFKLDSYLASLGVNLGRPSAGMGAMGLIMAASRIFSQIGRGGAGTDGGASAGGGSPSGDPAGSGMPEGSTEPIPMRPGEEADQRMDHTGMSSDGDFDETADTSRDTSNGFEETMPETGGSVMEELGMVTAETVDGTENGAEIRTDIETGIGGLHEAGANGGSSTESVPGIDGGPAAEGTDGFTSDTQVHVDSAGDGAMDMNAGIPGFGEETGFDAGENTTVTGGEQPSGGIQTAEAGGEAGYGTGDGGIISEIGDYPVEEEVMENGEEHIMELDGSTIESMGSGMETEGVSAGAAGDVYGGTGITSRGSGAAGTSSGADASHAAAMPGIVSTEGSDGILSEVGTDFETGGIAPFGEEENGIGNTFGEMTEDAADFGHSSAAASSDADFQWSSHGILQEMGSGEAGKDVNERGTGAYASGDGEMRMENAFDSGEGIDAGAMEPYGSGSTMDTKEVKAYGSDSGMGIGDTEAYESSGGIETGMEDTNPGGDAGSAYFYDGGTGMEAFGEEQNSGTESAGVYGTKGSAEAAAGSTAISGMSGQHMESSGEQQSMMADGVNGSMPLQELGSRNETVSGGKEAAENLDQTQAEVFSSAEPTEHMDGQMNQMNGSIPAGNGTIPGEKKPSRRFREVPRSREELRRRQQGRDGNGTESEKPLR